MINQMANMKILYSSHFAICRNWCGTKYTKQQQKIPHMNTLSIQTWDVSNN